jgi:hypothetical protein
LRERGDVYGPTLAAIAARSRVIHGRVVVVFVVVLRSPLARLAVHVPRPGVVGDVLRGPAPLHAVRVLHRSRRQRRHALCLAAPGVPLRCVVGGATAPARDRASAAVVPRAGVRPSRSGLVMPVAQEGNRPAKPSAPRLRARLDAGLGKVRRLVAALVLARWPRAALPPSAVGRSAGVRAGRPDVRRRLAPHGRFPCSDLASRRLFLAASGWAAVGGHAVLPASPKPPAKAGTSGMFPPRNTRSVCRFLVLPPS